MGYIYLGKYFHRTGKELNLSEKKIGKTINLREREHELGRTKSPIGYTYINAWDTGDDMDRVEKQIHSILKHDRCQDTEWFEDADDSLNARIGDFMRYGGYIEVDLGQDKDADINQVIKEEKEKKSDLLLREKWWWLTGKTFYLTRLKWNSTLSIQIQKDGFYCLDNKTLYDSLHKSATQPLFDTLKNQVSEEEIRQKASVNAWTESKDENGSSIDKALKEKRSEIRSNMKSLLLGETFQMEIDGKEISFTIQADGFYCLNNQKLYDNNWHGAWASAADEIIPGGRKNPQSGMGVWDAIDKNGKTVNERLDEKVRESLMIPQEVA